MPHPLTLLQISGRGYPPAPLRQSTLLIIDAQEEYRSGALRLPGLDAAAAETDSRTAVAQQLAADPDLKLSDVEVEIEGENLRAVRVEVSGRYGSDLARAAERVRALAETVVAETTGQDADVTITVIDVHR